MQWHMRIWEKLEFGLIFPLIYFYSLLLFELQMTNFLGFTVAGTFKNILLVYTYVANEIRKLLWKVLTATSSSGRIIYKYIATSTSVTLT